jgi:hypothetical protein
LVAADSNATRAPSESMLGLSMWRSAGPPPMALLASVVTPLATSRTIA